MDLRMLALSLQRNPLIRKKPNEWARYPAPCTARVRQLATGGASYVAGSPVVFNRFLVSSTALLESGCEFTGFVPDAVRKKVLP
jgi:hypothetical protein